MKMKVVNNKNKAYGTCDYGVFGNWLSGSCGARYVDKIEQASTGITICPGHQGKQHKNQYGQVKHLSGKAGDFTVKTKYVL